MQDGLIRATACAGPTRDYEYSFKIGTPEVAFVVNMQVAYIFRTARIPHIT